MGEVKKTNILPPYLVLSAMLIMYLLDKYFPLVEWQNTRLFAVALMVLSFFCILYCAYMFHKHHTEIKPLEESTFLILSWPYTISRNPIYLCMALFLLGWWLWLQSLSCLLMVVIFIFWIHHRFILQEEIMLEQTFGDEYLSYKQSTRRWL